MDPSRLDRGLQIAGGGGIALLVSLFLPWYGVKVSLGVGSISSNATAWQVFSYTDLILFLVSLVAIGAAAATASGNLPALPAPLGQIVLGAGALALVLVLFRFLDVPGPSGAGVGRKFGLFVGLLASAAVAYGGSQIRPVPSAAPLA